MNGHCENFPLLGGDFHHCFLRLLREIKYRVHPHLDFVGQQFRILGSFHLYTDHTHIFTGKRSHLLDSVEIPNFFLNLLTDAILHFQWSCSGVGNGYGDQIEVEVGKELHL